ncbi:MAG: hypothetical protein IKL10_10605 [Clostridia bacterium]|nr:hypothetical protein [Clostridia bacterium]
MNYAFIEPLSKSLRMMSTVNKIIRTANVIQMLSSVAAFAVVVLNLMRFFKKQTI